MKLRFEKGVIVRTCNDESLVWNPRTGGCVVASNVGKLLAEIKGCPRQEDEIVSAFADSFGDMEGEAEKDARKILKILSEQKLIEQGECKGGIEQFSVNDSDINNGDESEDIEGRSAVEEFCSRHNILSDLHIDLTNRCNELCVHCYMPKGGTTDLHKDLAFKVLREFREMEGLTVYLSGGECLLHPDFAEIAREAKRLGLNIIVMTNLSLCDAQKVALFKEIDPQFVNVSLYSMKATEHEAITCVPGSWEKTMEAIRALKEAGVHIRLAAPLMRENKDAAAGLLDFAAKENMHCILGCDIVGRIDHNCSNQKHALSVDEIEKVIREHKGVLCRGRLNGDKCAAGAKVCDIGIGMLNVNAKGDYYPCDGFHGMVLGNAKTDKLSDVWHCEKLNRLRALKNRDFKSCVGCQNRPWCKVCLMRNFNETGDMMTPDPLRCALSAVHRIVWKEG